MLTPQEVASRAFPKAVMGGYNMASVDEFLDELSDDYSALYKENAALKSKLKVLVEKVEDYRATEDSMRATLLTAQKMADSIVKEAEQKRDGMLAQAKDEAQAQMGELDRQRRESEARLAQGKQELADFIATARSACEKELEFLSRLDSLAVVPEAPSADQQADAAAEEIHEHLAETEPEPEPQPESQEAPQADEYPEGNPFEAEADSEPARRIPPLDDLKFGKNY